MNSNINNRRLRFIDMSSFKLVYDTNEFRIGQKNLLPTNTHISNSNNHHQPTRQEQEQQQYTQDTMSRTGKFNNTLRRKAYPGNDNIIKKKMFSYVFDV